MEQIVNYFAQQGVLGIIILMLIGVVVWQQKRLDKKDTLISEVLEKRKTDTDLYTASYTAIVKENVASQRDAIAAQQTTQKSLDSLITAVQTFIQK